jgi:Plasmid pRiA4b ORF-3-like protein
MTNAYQLHIELCHFEPTVYRDVLVDPATTLPKLHKLIQTVMGWENTHMHGFALPLRKESYYTVPGSRRYENPELASWDDPANNEAHYKAQDLLKKPKDTP